MYIYIYVYIYIHIYIYGKVVVNMEMVRSPFGVEG